jgi:hypothetical protein
MTDSVWWYVLAGFILGFILSTLWEWLFFRRRRMRIESQRIAELEESVRTLTTTVQTTDGGASGSYAAGYQSPGVFLEGEEDEIDTAEVIVPAPDVYAQPAAEASAAARPQSANGNGAAHGAPYTEPYTEPYTPRYEEPYQEPYGEPFTGRSAGEYSSQGAEPPSNRRPRTGPPAAGAAVPLAAATAGAAVAYSAKQKPEPTAPTPESPTAAAIPAPTSAAGPVYETEPAQPVQPVQTAQPIQTVQPVPPAQPAQTVQPVQPVQPLPAAPPAQPNQPTQFGYAAQSGPPDQPPASAQPSLPNQAPTAGPRTPASFVGPAPQQPAPQQPAPQQHTPQQHTPQQHTPPQAVSYQPASYPPAPDARTLEPEQAPWLTPENVAAISAALGSTLQPDDGAAAPQARNMPAGSPPTAQAALEAVQAGPQEQFAAGVYSAPDNPLPAGRPLPRVYDLPDTEPGEAPPPAGSARASLREILPPAAAVSPSINGSRPRPERSPAGDTLAAGGLEPELEQASDTLGSLIASLNSLIAKTQSLLDRAGKQG